jgi:hypothetical protein
MAIRIFEDASQTPLRRLGWRHDRTAGRDETPRCSREVRDTEAESSRAGGRVAGSQGIDLEDEAIALAAEVYGPASMTVLRERESQRFVEASRSFDVGSSNDQETEVERRHDASPSAGGFDSLLARPLQRAVRRSRGTLAFPMRAQISRLAPSSRRYAATELIRRSLRRSNFEIDACCSRILFPRAT